ncbi:hypothetical protein UlMin_022267 [Ulmus minor]
MKRKKWAQGWINPKFDLEKAYDRVSWEFIEVVLTTFGFSACCINWVTKCISTTTTKLMLSGFYYQDIKPKRGLRQGDPISPYLFIICTKIMSKLLINKVDVGDIHGLKLTRGGSRLHHLLFVDDIFLFGKACVSEVAQIKESLDTFYDRSGLTFNSFKSNIFFSANTKSYIVN